MKKLYPLLLVGGVIVLAGGRPAVAAAQVYAPTVSELRSQLSTMLTLIERLPAATAEQINQKIRALNQALRLQLQVEGLSSNAGASTAGNESGTGTGTGTGSSYYSDASPYTFSPYSPSLYSNYSQSSYSYNYTPNISARTGPTEQGTPTSARITGIIARTGNAAETINAWFEWNTDPNLDNQSGLKATPQTSFQVQNGTIGTSAVLYNLLPQTQYFYRLVVSTVNGGIKRGDVLNFVTSPQYQTQYYYNY